MSISFEKYHGAGNDFILIDNRDSVYLLNKEYIARLCDRHLGIGADGLILIQPKENYDFEMIYYNADGGIGSMCGNGGRCAVIFARKLGIIKNETKFLAFDGSHNATIISDGSVKLSMSSVAGITTNRNGFILNTGSPHLIEFVDAVTEVDVYTEGKKIRYSDSFKEKGINVNFVSINDSSITMRTYERGVENETLSCGTGTVAVAIAVSVKNKRMGEQSYTIQSPGGILKVHFNRKGEDVFENVFLEGPVKFVFAGNTEF